MLVGLAGWAELLFASPSPPTTLPEAITGGKRGYAVPSQKGRHLVFCLTPYDIRGSTCTDTEVLRGFT